MWYVFLINSNSIQFIKNPISITDFLIIPQAVKRSEPNQEIKNLLSEDDLIWDIYGKNKFLDEPKNKYLQFGRPDEMGKKLSVWDLKDCLEFSYMEKVICNKLLFIMLVPLNN